MFDQLNTDEKTAKIELYNLKQAHKQLNKNYEVKTLYFIVNAELFSCIFFLCFLMDSLNVMPSVHGNF